MTGLHDKRWVMSADSIVFSKYHDLDRVAVSAHGTPPVEKSLTWTLEVRGVFGDRNPTTDKE